jgi:signal transduction histidine kinase/ligand-binding sensor domain-containing protein
MKRSLLIILFIAFWRFCLAQSSAVKFDHFTIMEGLPEASVQFIRQDSQGYIWMGTQNGLLRYDGYKPRVYKLRGNNVFTLNASMTTNMIEDNNKDLWFSTVGNGLFKYNRSKDNFSQFVYPTIKGDNSLINDYVTAVDPSNNIWAYHTNKSGDGDYDDIVKFDEKSLKYEFYNRQQKGSHYLNASKVYMLEKTKSGQIWIGTNNGLYQYNVRKDQLEGYLASRDKQDKTKITMVYEAPSEPGILWLNLSNSVTKQTRILRFDTRSKRYQTYNPGAMEGFTAANDTINAVFESRGKQLWFGTMDGLMSLDRNSAVFKKYLPIDTIRDPGKNKLYGMVEGHNGTLWIKSRKGMLNFDPGSKTFQRFLWNPEDPFAITGDYFDSLGSISDDLLIDNSGTLWVCVDFSGVDKVNQLTSTFTNYSQKTWVKTNYPGGSPRQLKNMPDGYIWFSTRNGYYKWLPDSKTFISLYTGKNIVQTRSAFDASKAGVLYFSTEEGFCVLDTKTHKLQRYSNVPGDVNSLSSNTITHILQDHTGLVWIGTDGGGICSFDPATHRFKRYPYITNNAMIRVKGPLDDLTVNTIFEDAAGTLWVGTNYGGLNRLNRKTDEFDSFLYAGNRRVVCITSMYEDRKGRFWVGSYLDGLYEFDRKTERYTLNYSEANGLLFNSVTSITADQNGAVWALSMRGLTRIDPDTRSLKNFPLKTILPGQQLSGILSSNLLSYKDRMLISLLNGFSVFNPIELKGNSYPPIVHIEQVAYSNPKSAGNRLNTFQTYRKKSLSLPWKDNRLSFNYIALHFTNPGGNTYAYFLDGYDKHWVQAGTSRTVTYNNLSPGTYTFHVRAANSDGVWNTSGDSFTVIIRSPWWLRWWAWLLYIIVALGAMYVFVLYRSRALRKENEQLEKRVLLRTNELKEANEQLNVHKAAITVQRDQLSEKIKELEATQEQLIQSEKLASLGELTAGIAHEIQNPLNFVNNFSEVSMELVDELQAELQVGDTSEAQLIAEDVKQNLSKIRHHGMRADGIVKSMLEHSRAGHNVKVLTNINKLADEYMRLAYHGLRAKDNEFNSKLTMNFQESLPDVEVVQQDIGRVLLNLFNNAFYSVNQKRKTNKDVNYFPEVSVSTFVSENMINILVRDNGKGIPDAIKEKIMQPFFTTKPTGEGTGLGLSLSYDIIVRGHGGSITVDSEENEYSLFTIKLPLSAKPA